MLKKEDGQLDFTEPADALARRVRAFQPWPGTFTIWQGQPLKILRACAVAEKPAVPGARLVYQGLPALGTASGLLVLEELQPAGKKTLPGKIFLQGARAWLEQD
jgi:methionyl-tRNA formyltransferase